jgi:hypothetical protein
MPSLIPLKEPDPRKIHERYMATKDPQKLSHAGRELTVSTPRRSQFGTPPGALSYYDKLSASLEQLKQIAETLSKDAKYAKYASELLEIHQVLLNVMDPLAKRRA